MSSQLTNEDIQAKVEAGRSHVVEIRRALHREPELGLSTPKTQARIVEELERIGIAEIRLGTACTSVVAEIRGEAGAGDRCIALRADMDALPLTEHADQPWVSRHEGRMHACGHDAHVAMLIGAAEVLHAERDKFAGTVRLLFQPGEEGYGGAVHMIDEGALNGVDRAFAIHVEPGRAPHVVAWCAGTILAAFDNFSVTFRGAGGHASTPHLAKDPIPAIGPFVDGLSHVAAREIDPYDRAVLSVTKVSAGTTDNVIPPTACCVGTIRSLGKKGRERARAALVRVAQGVAASRGLEVDVDLVEGYPPTINDADAVASVVATSRAMGLVDEQMIGPFMGAEDFSYVLDRVPGAFVFLGSRVADGGPLHSDLMKLDEDVLATGSALHVAVALRMLSD